MNINDISPAVNQLHATFNSGVTKSLDWRATQLNALKAMLTEKESVFLDALKADLGKGEFEGFVSEVGFVIGEIDMALKNLKKWSKKRSVSTPIAAQPGSSYLLPEPLGTILVIGAWNYPVQLVLGPVVAALAAGNCVLIKPSEVSMNCSQAIAKYVPQYLSKDACTVVEGAVDETTELLKQRFDHILYTGGEGVAKIVMRAAAEHLTPVTLELGGKSPCIVDGSVNVDMVAARIAWSKWMNAGQTCVAPDYILVAESHADDLVTALKQKLVAFYGKKPKESQDYGRIVNQRHSTRLASYLENQNVVHGGATDIENRYIEPTLVMNPRFEDALMQEEIFGPILPIVTVPDINDAISIVNARPKPLAMYVFTKDQAFEDKVLSSISAGNVCVNDGMMFMANPHLPFGGVGNSGMGRYHGKFGFDTFSHLKAVIKRGVLLDPSLRYPPYTKLKLSIIKTLV